MRLAWLALGLMVGCSSSDGSDGAGDTSPSTTCLEEAPPPIDVPAGAFVMGCDQHLDDIPCYSDERPAHTVTLGAYRIDAVEVTVSAYRECVDSGQCTEPTDLSNADCNYPHADRPLHPVNCLAWSQADAYCRFRDGRLPTEAEWERAARGTDERMFPWGNTSPSCDEANFSGCSPASRPIGCFPDGRSAIGAFDMAGNVAEYTNDWYFNEYYAASPSADPAGPESGSHRVVRGGSYYDFNHFQRTTFRGGNDPSDVPFDYIGFRCAYDAL